MSISQEPEHGAHVNLFICLSSVRLLQLAASLRSRLDNAAVAHNTLEATLSAAEFITSTTSTPGGNGYGSTPQHTPTTTAAGQREQQQQGAAQQSSVAVSGSTTSGAGTYSGGDKVNPNGQQLNIAAAAAAILRSGSMGYSKAAADMPHGGGVDQTAGHQQQLQQQGSSSLHALLAAGGEAEGLSAARPSSDALGADLGAMKAQLAELTAGLVHLATNQQQQEQQPAQQAAAKTGPRGERRVSADFSFPLAPLEVEAEGSGALCSPLPQRNTRAVSASAPVTSRAGTFDFAANNIVSSSGRGQQQQQEQGQLTRCATSAGAAQAERLGEGQGTRGMGRSMSTSSALQHHQQQRQHEQQLFEQEQVLRKGGSQQLGIAFQGSNSSRPSTSLQLEPQQQEQQQEVLVAGEVSGLLQQVGLLLAEVVASTRPDSAESSDGEGEDQPHAQVSANAERGGCLPKERAEALGGVQSRQLSSRSADGGSYQPPRAVAQNVDSSSRRGAAWGGGASALATVQELEQQLQATQGRCEKWKGRYQQLAGQLQEVKGILAHAHMVAATQEAAGQLAGQQQHQEQQAGRQEDVVKLKEQLKQARQVRGANEDRRQFKILVVAHLQDRFVQEHHNSLYWAQPVHLMLTCISSIIYVSSNVGNSALNLVLEIIFKAFGRSHCTTPAVLTL